MILSDSDRNILAKLITSDVIIEYIGMDEWDLTEDEENQLLSIIERAGEHLSR